MRLRLRSTLALVVICAGVATVGAWTDKPRVDVQAKPTAVTATKGWNALVEISRRGRRLDGFRPTMTIQGFGDPRTFTGKAVAPGKYRVSVIFPMPGYYTYTVKVADSVEARGTIYAIPN
jgi:hypothetical protein